MTGGIDVNRLRINDTLWNVNIRMTVDKSMATDELIDTLWNVNLC